MRVGPLGGQADLIELRAGGDAMDEAVPLFSGDIEVQVQADWTRAGQVAFSGDQPLPVTICAHMLRMEVANG